MSPTSSGDTPPEAVDAASQWARTRTALQTQRSRAETWLDEHRDRVLVDLVLRLIERDRESAATVVSSALAFRLFLFFLPLVLFAVGLSGFASSALDRRDIEALGITGQLAEQIDQALRQSQGTRWIATLGGLFGALWAGRTLGKVTNVASCLAWRIPVRTKGTLRVSGALVGVVVGMALMSVLVNTILTEHGVVLAGLSFVGVAAVYCAFWFALSLLLSRATTDPAALLPGAALVGVAVAGLQAFSQLYLPRQFSQASDLYGAVGASIVVLGWFFIMGRVIVGSMVVSAVVYERFGSIASVVFGLPVLRAIPQRWPAVARFFDLADPEPEPPDVPR